MSSTSSNMVLKVNNLPKIYGREFRIFGERNIPRYRKIGRKVTAVRNASFSVKKGEIFGFLGPNGSGKTTTIRAILDYLHVFFL